MKLSDVKKNLALVDDTRRQALGTFLVGVAAADGHLDRREIGLLSKLYALLGAEETKLYDDLHSFGLAREIDRGPVTVAAAEPSGGFAIPARRQEGQTLTLDPALVQAKLAESAAVAALLEGIFAQDEPSLPAPPPSGDQPSPVTGLDAVHSALLRELATRSTWARSHLEECTARFSVLPDGAIEVLNERALDLTGEPLLEGDDPILLNPTVLKELMA